MKIINFPCVCGHNAEMHFGMWSYTSNGIDLEVSRPGPCECHNCSKFVEMTNLEYLESKYARADR